MTSELLRCARFRAIPLILKAQGSFFVGGQKVEQTKGELGNLGPGGQIVVEQMYVRYMVPQAGDGIPVVMVHGATLTGKTWETTPDGRMDWDEYFVRKGHPVYLPDQVGRGRSGFNQAIYNNVRAGGAPPANQPELLSLQRRKCMVEFSLRAQGRVAFDDSQFPIGAVDELAKQAVPDMNRGLATPTPTIKALSDLASQLNGAVLMGHSQSGSFPLAAALIDPKVTKALVLVEPGSHRCNDNGRGRGADGRTGSRRAHRLLRQSRSRVAELGICGVAAAVANAIYNASGVRVREYPIMLDKLLDRLPSVS